MGAPPLQYPLSVDMRCPRAPKGEGDHVDHHSQQKQHGDDDVPSPIARVSSRGNRPAPDQVDCELDEPAPHKTYRRDQIDRVRDGVHCGLGADFSDGEGQKRDPAHEQEQIRDGARQQNAHQAAVGSDGLRSVLQGGSEA